VSDEEELSVLEEYRGDVDHRIELSAHIRASFKCRRERRPRTVVADVQRGERRVLDRRWSARH